MFSNYNRYPAFQQIMLAKEYFRPSIPVGVSATGNVVTVWGMASQKRSLLTAGCRVRYDIGFEWWRHQMEAFSALLAICAGNSPASGEIPAQRPVTRNFDVFFDLCLNKRLRKQSWGWWFETLSSPLRRHCNGMRGVMCLWILHSTLISDNRLPIHIYARHDLHFNKRCLLQTCIYNVDNAWNQILLEYVKGRTRYYLCGVSVCWNC